MTDELSLDECFAQGLLRKDEPDIEKAKRSILVAKHKLENARAVFDAKIYEDAIVDAYSAMFHAARALLFRDGVKERGHYAVYVYIKTNYADKLEARFINELNTLRAERHALSYELEPLGVREVEAESAIAVAAGFIRAVEKLM